MPVIHVQRAREQTARRPGAMDGSGGTRAADARGALVGGLSCIPILVADPAPSSGASRELQ